MTKEYLVKRIVDIPNFSKDIWESVPGIYIDCYQWDINGYTPKTEVKLYYTDSNFNILFKSYEKDIKAIYHNMHDPVCKDSCVEFFFNPNPEMDNRYLNFEVNPIGTLLLGMGKDRYDRTPITEESPESFNIISSVSRDTINDYNGEFWTIQYSIPFNFIKKYYGNLEFTSGTKIAGNFYKCGDDTLYPHYGSWSPVVSKTPDFHRPESFGSIILE